METPMASRILVHFNPSAYSAPVPSSAIAASHRVSMRSSNCQWTLLGSLRAKMRHDRLAGLILKKP
jgi:hypothetical protein